MAKIQTEAVAPPEHCAREQHHAFNALAVAVRARMVRWFAARRPAASHMTDDDVSIAALQTAVEHMQGVPARFVESVEVDERYEGKPVSQGAVKVFDLKGHPSGAKRAYAWSYATTGTKGRFMAVLGAPPVDGRMRPPSPCISDPAFSRGDDGA
jgi:hypothetical protein